MKQISRNARSMGLRRGFTLIELLVVVAIIALLMGIIMPSLNAAKKHAQGVACASNVRQLSIAWIGVLPENWSSLRESMIE